MEWINDELRQAARRSRLGLAMLLHAHNRILLSVIPDRPSDAVDCYVVQAVERLARANLGGGFEALQAAVKFDVLRALSYSAMRQIAVQSPEFARCEQERVALLRMPS